MLVWAIKILSLNMITFSVFQGLLSMSFLATWIFLELSTISFLFYLFCSSKNMLIKESMKLFLIQALSGLLVLVLILQTEFFTSKLMIVFTAVVIMFKMSAAPFHGWFLSLINEIVWDVIFIFLTLMKFIPLMILTSLNLNSMEVFAVLSFMAAAFSSLYLTNLKKLSMVSSVFFLGMLYTLMMNSNIWVDLLITYSIMFLGTVLYFLKSNEVLSSSQSHSSGSMMSLMGFIMLINMAGLPPFPGFFLKLIWVVQASPSLISFLVFISASSLMMFMYLSFGLKILGEMSSEFLIAFQMNFTGVVFMMMIVVLMTSPLMWMI